MFSRSLWSSVSEDDHPYIHRCSFCGKFKRKLKRHWFFTGIYCVACIQDVLYDNARNISEVGVR